MTAAGDTSTHDVVVVSRTVAWRSVVLTGLALSAAVGLFGAGVAVGRGSRMADLSQSVSSTTATSQEIPPETAVSTPSDPASSTEAPSEEVSAVEVRDLAGLVDKPGLSTSAGARLAVIDQGNLYVVSKGNDARYVGPAEMGAWSRDGRYLAALYLLDPASGWDGELGLWVFDTETGEELRWVPREPGARGTIFGVSDGFAVPLKSGAERWDRGAMSFVMVDPDEMHDGLDPSVVSWDFTDTSGIGIGENDPMDFDFDWVDAEADSLYVVVTEASNTWYRYDPILWRVGVDGSSEPIYDECTFVEDNNCLSNYGMPATDVAPGGSFVAYTGGVRNGCETYFEPRLVHLLSRRIVLLHGLPDEPEGPRSGHDMYSIGKTFGSFDWTSEDSFLATFHAYLSGREADGSCYQDPIGEPQLHECSIAGDCQPLGIEAGWAVGDDHGNIAWAQPHRPVGDSDLVTIRWADGSERTVITSGVAAWAP